MVSLNQNAEEPHPPNSSPDERAAKQSLELALKNVEEQFRALVLATSEVVYQMSADWSEMRRLEGREFLTDMHQPNRGWMEKYILPEDRPLILAAIEKAIKSKSLFELEHRVKQADGSVGWTFSRAVPLFDDKQNIVEWFGAASDITERKRAEERYEQNLRLFNGVASTTPDFVYIFDLQGCFLYANRRLLEVWGMKLPDVIGKTCRQLGYEQWHHDMHMREIAQVIATKQPIKGEVPFKAPLTGIFGVYEYIFTPVLDEHGNVEIIAGTTRDVTERKRAEEAAQQQGERLRAAIAGSKGFEWEVPADLSKSHGFGEAVTLSSEHKALIGYADEEFPNSSSKWIARIDPADLPAIEAAAIAHVQRKAPFYTVEYRIQHRDGSWRYVASTGRLQRDAEGKAVRWVGVDWDITERKQSNEALREAHQRLQYHTQNTPLALVEFDAQMNVCGWSDAAEKLFGFTAAEAVGKHIWDIPWVCEDDLKKVQRVAGALEDRATQRNVSLNRNVRKDGKVIWCEWYNSSLTDSTGKMLSIQSLVLDVTARKEAEEILRRGKAELEQLVAERTAKLQEAVSELEHFSYTITHDMRAPLRAMRGFAEIISGPEEECTPEERAKFIQRIITAAERMDGLIADALHYSKVVRSEVPLGPVNVGQLLRGMLETYPEFQSTQSNIIVDEPLPVVMGNEAALTQCFSNLLDNAVKFALPGKKPQVRIWAEPRCGTGEGNRTPEWVRFWIEDKGIGISEPMKRKVFDMFAHGSNPKAGTGIGLALVRKVVERMGGKIGVESEEGRGSRFWVELKRGPSAGTPLM